VLQVLYLSSHRSPVGCQGLDAVASRVGFHSAEISGA
jgi:hypothetical protein